MSSKVLLKNRTGEMEGLFYAFQLPTSPAYSGWKVEVNVHCTKMMKGKRREEKL